MSLHTIVFKDFPAYREYLFILSDVGYTRVSLRLLGGFFLFLYFFFLFLLSNENLSFEDFFVVCDIVRDKEGMMLSKIRKKNRLEDRRFEMCVCVRVCIKIYLYSSLYYVK